LTGQQQNQSSESVTYHQSCQDPASPAKEKALTPQEHLFKVKGIKRSDDAFEDKDCFIANVSMY